MGIVKNMASSEIYEEIVRKIDELRRDSKKFEDYIAARVDAAVKHWPRR